MDWRKYLPSAQFSLFTGAIAIAAVLIYAASFIGSGTRPSFLSAETPNDGAREIATTDSDLDNLPDWEEAVRGTNPKNADTDGDGSFDGEEVAAARDPKKPGPNDTILSKENEAFVNELLASASSTNITTEMSQRLFAQYLAAYNSGSSGSSVTQESLVQDAVAQAKVPLRGKTYSRSDLTIVPDTKENIRYFASLSMYVIHAHEFASFPNTVLVFGSAVEESKQEAIPVLEKLGEAYHIVADDLSRVPVPESYAAEYLQMINAYEKASGSFEDMRYAIEDPVRGVAGFTNYSQMIRLNENVVTSIANKIVRSGILFTANEYGSIWGNILSEST